MAEQKKQDSTEGNPPMKAPEPVPSTSKISKSTRIQRNVAEKQRRDKLNGYISELANIVPMVSMSSKRLDKTSILRLSAAHLRLSKSPLGGSKKLKKSFKWCPNFLTTNQVRDILESVDGFLVVTSASGKILFTSHSVERYLGHQNIDMIGHSLFLFIHADDVDSVKEEMGKLLTASLKYVNTKRNPRCSFRCRMKEKGQPRSEVVTYQCVHFVGDMTISDEDESTANKLKNSAIVTHIFKAFIRVVDANPYNQLSLEEAIADEYVTRHSLDGTIIFADHRLSTITGHLPQEVIGKSAYDYIVPDDVPIALFAHHLMFSSNKGTGMIVYRLNTREDKHVYLKSIGCLQYDRVTSQVDHFVCVNHYLSTAEGEAQLKYFVDRFIPHIKDSSTRSLLESVKALQTMGFKAPSSFGALNESSFKSTLSTTDLSKASSSASEHNIVHNNKILSSPALKEINKFPQIETPCTTACGSGLKSSTSHSSSVKKIPIDKSNHSGVNLPHQSVDFQIKENILINNETEFNNKKSICNIPTQLSQSSMMNNTEVNTHLPFYSDNTLHVAQPKLVQKQDTCSLNIQAINGLTALLPPQDISIKNEILCEMNSMKNNTYLSENNTQYLNYNNDLGINYHAEAENCSIQQFMNSNYIGMDVMPTSSLAKEGSFQMSTQTENMYNGFDHVPINDSYNVKIGTESVMPNTANIYTTMNATNFPDIKTNILLSTGSILYNDLSVSVPKTTDGNSETSLILNNNLILNKINVSDSEQLSFNVNDIVIDTTPWSAETSIGSNVSKNIIEETFSSSMECCNDIQNMFLMPGEEIKDSVLDVSDDISSLIESALPFDDSSLPSVDGWREFFTSDDVLDAHDSEMSFHIVDEQPFENSYIEKSLHM